MKKRRRSSGGVSIGEALREKEICRAGNSLTGALLIVKMVASGLDC
jgi:hypothetical protein